MFSDKIKKIFPELKKLVEYCDERDYIEIKVEGTEINFNKLFELSELLGTKNINLNHWKENDGCDTCGHGEKYIYSIVAKDIKWTP
ncbi:MAG: hypothetical protein KGO96_07095 [Elusimicrobia bacterium]|nr:hypothetical protein [Elusimicrobiota bacterium]